MLALRFFHACRSGCIGRVGKSAVNTLDADEAAGAVAFVALLEHRAGHELTLRHGAEHAAGESKVGDMVACCNRIMASGTCGRLGRNHFPQQGIGHGNTGKRIGILLADHRAKRTPVVLVGAHAGNRIRQVAGGAIRKNAGIGDFSRVVIHPGGKGCDAIRNQRSILVSRTDIGIAVCEREGSFAATMDAMNHALELIGLLEAAAIGHDSRRHLVGIVAVRTGDN